MMNADRRAAVRIAVPNCFFSIDVECVATGVEHNARSVAQISMVDQFERPALNIFVKPSVPIVSYLTDLTGLTKEIIDKHGIPFDQAVAILRQHLPKHAVLVGQNIRSDVQWLKLDEGRDFAGMIDLMGLLRVWNEKYNNYSYFSLEHEAKFLLGYQPMGPHNPMMDAMNSVKLFKLYLSIQERPEVLQQARQCLVDAPPTASFSKNNPTYEGVCMGNKRACACGAPFFI